MQRKIVLPTQESLREFDRKYQHAEMYGRRRFQELKERGFLRLTEECAAWLANNLRGKRVIEVGAGLGFLSAVLHERGVDVVAYDNRSGGYGETLDWYQSEDRSHFKVQNVDVTTMESFDCDVVLMSWPSQDSTFAEEVAAKLKQGQALIHVGEGKGGCGAPDSFFDALENEERWGFNDVWTDILNGKHSRYVGINDWWSVHYVNWEVKQWT